MSRSPLLFLGFVVLSTPLRAQVGHAPADSPFHDIRTETGWEFFGGHLGGSGGPIPVGPRNGTFAGFRVMLRDASTISLGLGVWGALAERTVLDPNATPAAQVVGRRDAHLLAGELTIQLNVTGGKNWHGLAPFAGVGLGLVKNLSGDDGDPGGYEFGSKLYFAPMAGARFFVSDRLYLRAEARGLTWKLKYPLLYGIEPVDDPGTAESPNAIDPLGRSGGYVVAPVLSLGFGISF